MKKLFLTLTIAILAIASYSQDTTLFVPNYGIKLERYSEVKMFSSDTLNLSYHIKFMYPKFTEKQVYFFYNVEIYNDSLLVKSKDNYIIELPLNAVVSGKKVYEWLNDLYSVQDTAILKGLAEKLYYYDLMQK